MKHDKIFSTHVYLLDNVLNERFLLDIRKDITSNYNPQTITWQGKANLHKQPLDCYFQLSDGVVNGLESKQILYKSSSIAELLTMSYNIQDVAYNILKKHPEYLNCSESKAI